MGMAVVDVRDVAKAHLLAMENGKAAGRHICVAESVWMLDMIALLLTSKDLANYGPLLPTKNLPKFLLYIIGRFTGLTWSRISTQVDKLPMYNTSKIKNKLGLTFRQLSATVSEMGKRFACSFNTNNKIYNRSCVGGKGDSETRRFSRHISRPLHRSHKGRAILNRICLLPIYG